MSDAETSELVAWEWDGGAPGATGVVVLRLNRPDQLNALTEDMGQAFARVVADLAAEPALRAVVLTGAGRAFSAGGDLAFLEARAADTPANNALRMRAFYRRFLAVRDLPVPVVAAVNGHAIGAGLCLAMACDLRVVAAEAKLGATFVGLGLHPGMGATHFFPLVAGNEVAAWLLLTGTTIGGEAAAARGLALEAAPGAGVLVRALELARTIAAQGPVAVKATVRSLRNRQEDLLERALWREADAQSQSYASADLRRGIDAVRSKQTPAFVGE